MGEVCDCHGAVAAAVMWMAVLLDIAQARILLGAPWARFASIMIVVFALTVMAAVRVGRMVFDKEGASPQATPPL